MLGISCSAKTHTGKCDISQPLKNALNQAVLDTVRPPNGTLSSACSECGEEESAPRTSDSPLPWDCFEIESPSVLPLPRSSDKTSQLMEILPQTSSPSQLPSSPPSSPSPNSMPSSTFKIKKRKEFASKPNRATRPSVDINPEFLNSRNICVTPHVRQPCRRSLDESTEKQLFEAVGPMVQRAAKRKGTKQKVIPQSEVGNAFLAGEKTSLRITSFVNEYTKSLKSVLFRTRPAKNSSAALYSTEKQSSWQESGNSIVAGSGFHADALGRTPSQNLDSADNHQVKSPAEDEPDVYGSPEPVPDTWRRRQDEKLSTFVDLHSEPENAVSIPKSSIPICTTPFGPPPPAPHWHRLGVDLRNVRMQRGRLAHRGYADRATKITK